MDYLGEFILLGPDGSSWTDERLNPQLIVPLHDDMALQLKHGALVTPDAGPTPIGAAKVTPLRRKRKNTDRLFRGLANPVGGFSKTGQLTTNGVSRNELTFIWIGHRNNPHKIALVRGSKI